MIVVYGKPVSDQNGEVMKNTDWNTCIGICYSSVSCILAWNQGSDCVTFNYTSTGPVTQLTNGSIVAFKVNSLEDQCPNGTNPPTFNNQNATGSLYITDSNANNKTTLVNYQIYLAGKTWNFSYSYNYSCPDRFISVIRSDNSIGCFRQWISTDSGGFSYDHALELCQNESATLAGISYQEDLNYMIGKIQELRYQVNNSNTYARIDGQRTGGCQSTPNRTAWIQMDGYHRQELLFYNWVTSSAAQATSNDNCLVLVANGSNPIRADLPHGLSTSTFNCDVQ